MGAGGPGGSMLGGVPSPHSPFLFSAPPIGGGGAASGVAHLTVSIRDCYWEGRLLQKGPFGYALLTVDPASREDGQLPTILARASALVGAQVTALLHMPAIGDDGQPQWPREISSAGDLLWCMEDAKRREVPIWALIDRDAPGGYGRQSKARGSYELRHTTGGDDGASFKQRLLSTSPPPSPSPRPAAGAGAGRPGGPGGAAGAAGAADTDASPELAARLQRLERLNWIALLFALAVGIALVAIAAWLGIGFADHTNRINTLYSGGVPAPAGAAASGAAGAPAAPSGSGATTKTPSSPPSNSSAPAASAPAPASAPTATSTPGPASAGGALYPGSKLSNGPPPAGHEPFFRNDNMYLGQGSELGDADGKTREYFVACVETSWDYGSGLTDYFGGHQDLLAGGQIPSPYLPRNDGKGWPKRLYIGFTDNTFTTPSPQPAWQGLLGPTIRAEVGDIIKVQYYNKCLWETTMHPHGVKYNVDPADGTAWNEGAWSQWTPDKGTQANVAPNAKTTYTWVAAVKSGPIGAGSDFSSQAWWYHSHIDEAGEVNQGLVGVILITAKGMANPDATPKDVDQEFIIYMMVQQEQNGASAGNMYSVNGKIFGNLSPFNMTNGDRVRWHLVSLGNQLDLHTVHWHGNALTFRGYRTDVIEIIPGSMATADMVADGLGLWLIHCHVNEHLEGGMVASYYVAPKPGQPNPTSYGPTVDFSTFGTGSHKMPHHQYPTTLRNIRKE